MPFPEFTPITVKNKKTNMIELLTVGELEKKYEDYCAWSHKGWTNINKVYSHSTNQPIYRLYNWKNWIYVDENTNFKLSNQFIKEKQLLSKYLLSDIVNIVINYLETINVKEIKGNTNLLNQPFPESNLVHVAEENWSARYNLCCDYCSCKYITKVDNIIKKRLDEEKMTDEQIKIMEFSYYNCDEFWKVQKEISDEDYYTCEECKDFDLCIACYHEINNNNIERVKYLNRWEELIDHDTKHKLKYIKKYTGIDILNSDNKKLTKEYLLQRKNNIEPFRLITWNFHDAQMNYMYGDKSGMKIIVPQSNMPGQIYYNFKYSNYIKNSKYSGTTRKSTTYNKYIESLRKNSPKKYVCKKFIKYNSSVETSSVNDIVYDPYNYRKDVPWTLTYPEPNALGRKCNNAGPMNERIDMYYNYREDVLYSIITENGYFQAGLGKLIIMC